MRQPPGWGGWRGWGGGDGWVGGREGGTRAPDRGRARRCSERAAATQTTSLQNEGGASRPPLSRTTGRRRRRESAEERPLRKRARDEERGEPRAERRRELDGVPAPAARQRGCGAKVVEDGAGCRLLLLLRRSVRVDGEDLPPPVRDQSPDDSEAGRPLPHQRLAGGARARERRLVRVWEVRCHRRAGDALAAVCARSRTWPKLALNRSLARRRSTSGGASSMVAPRSYRARLCSSPSTA